MSKRKEMLERLRQCREFHERGDWQLVIWSWQGEWDRLSDVTASCPCKVEAVLFDNLTEADCASLELEYNLLIRLLRIDDLTVEGHDSRLAGQPVKEGDRTRPRAIMFAA